MKQRSLKELSLKRIATGVFRRIKAIPHKILWNISQYGKTNRSNIEKFHNIHKGKRCFLIANGPSLNKTNLDLLKGEITFGMNRIYLNYPNMNFKPNYLVCINKLVLSQFKNDFKLEEMPKFFNWQSRKYFKDVNNTFFLEKNFAGETFSKEIHNSISPSATVTYAALQIIYYMGFKEVIIIGMDHNFTYHGKPNETQVRKEEKDVNHFAPNYFAKGFKWDVPDLTATEYFYQIAENTFNQDGRKIYDATINGKCEIFEKRTLEDFFI